MPRSVRSCSSSRTSSRWSSPGRSCSRSLDTRPSRRRCAPPAVAALTLLIAIPLAANSIVAIALSGWSAAIRDHAVAWIAETPGATIDDVRWTGLTATIDVTTRDGVIPPTADLAAAIGDAVPDSVSIAVDVRITAEYPVR
jgi:hypothetical protein